MTTSGTVATVVSVAGAFQFKGALYDTLTCFSTPQNAYNPVTTAFSGGSGISGNGSACTTWVVTSGASAPLVLNGIAAPPSSSSLILLINGTTPASLTGVGAVTPGQVITINKFSGSASAANQFNFGATLNPQQSVLLQYDYQNAYWTAVNLLQPSGGALATQSGGSYSGNLPANCSNGYALLWAGGGGGGSGYGTNTAVTHTGGSGGNSGCISRLEFPALASGSGISNLGGSAWTATVGTGGTGGAASNSGSNAGTAGGTTTFSIVISGVTYTMTATGGAGGNAGNSTAAPNTAPALPTSGGNIFLGSQGGAGGYGNNLVGSAINAASIALTPAYLSEAFPTGGGGGSGIDSTGALPDTLSGAGGNTLMWLTTALIGQGGQGVGNSALGVVSKAGATSGWCGSGGGGGGIATGATANNKAAGAGVSTGYGAGGGGGGGHVGTGKSGAGGNGASGLLVIITY